MMHIKIDLNDTETHWNTSSHKICMPGAPHFQDFPTWVWNQTLKKNPPLNFKIYSIYCNSFINGF